MRCERFVEELESYAKQVEEFYSYGDMQEINRYLKKAQALNAKLDAAADKVNLKFLMKASVCRTGKDFCLRKPLV